MTREYHPKTRIDDLDEVHQVSSTTYHPKTTIDDLDEGKRLVDGLRILRPDLSHQERGEGGSQRVRGSGFVGMRDFTGTRHGGCEECAEGFGYNGFGCNVLRGESLGLRCGAVRTLGFGLGAYRLWEGKGLRASGSGLRVWPIVWGFRAEG